LSPLQSPKKFKPVAQSSKQSCKKWNMICKRHRTISSSAKLNVVEKLSCNAYERCWPELEARKKQKKKIEVPAY
jgi:predicted component of type VI protein secretion system